VDWSAFLLSGKYLMFTSLGANDLGPGRLHVHLLLALMVQCSRRFPLWKQGGKPLRMQLAMVKSNICRSFALSGIDEQRLHHVIFMSHN